MSSLGWRKNRVATCHSDREYYAKGLCRPCYESARPKRKQNPATGRKKHAKLKFGLSLEQYDKLIQEAKVCGLCSKPFVSNNGPVLDHNHKTGKHRLVIHRLCNAAIGIFNDDPTLCRLAAEYLECHS